MSADGAPPSRKAARILLWCAIGLVVGLLAALLAPRAFSSEDPPRVVRVELASAPAAAPAAPYNAAYWRNRWVTRYRLGALGHARPVIHYAPGFKLWYKSHARRAYNYRHPHRPFRPEVSWRRFTARDRCVAVVMVGSPSLPGCRTDRAYSNKMDRLLHDSAYWRERSRMQNVWTNRVVLCGGTMFVAYATHAGRVGVVGGGGTCMAGTVIPTR